MDLESIIGGVKVSGEVNVHWHWDGEEEEKDTRNRSANPNNEAPRRHRCNTQIERRNR